MNRSFKIASICVVVLCLALLAWFGSRSADSDGSVYALGHGSFSGIVVNGIDDLPIAGAQLEVRDIDIERAYASDYSDVGGEFSLALEDGNYLVEASALGFTPRGRDDLGRQVTVMSGTHFVNAKLKLWPPAQITGRILDGQRGLKASIELAYEYDASGAEDYVFRQIDSAEDGRFVLDNVYAGLAIISVSSPGFASVTLGNIALQFGSRIDLGDIPLREGVSVYGRISDAVTGKPISGARIILHLPREPKPHEISSLHSGQYRLGAVLAKRVGLTVKAEGYRDFHRTLRLKSKPNHQLDVDMRRAWGLNLDVRNETNRRPLRTQVVITDMTSGDVVYQEWVENGELTLDALRGGPFEIFAQSYDKRTKLTLNAELGQKVDVVLKPGAKLKFRAYGGQGEVMENPSYRYYYRESMDEQAQLTPWFSFEAPGTELKDLDAGFYQVELRFGDRELKFDELHLMPGDVREQSIGFNSIEPEARPSLYKGPTLEVRDPTLEVRDSEHDMESWDQTLEEGVEPEYVYEKRFEDRLDAESYPPTDFQPESELERPLSDAEASEKRDAIDAPFEERLLEAQEP